MISKPTHVGSISKATIPTTTPPMTNFIRFDMQNTLSSGGRALPPPLTIQCAGSAHHKSPAPAWLTRLWLTVWRVRTTRWPGRPRRLKHRARLWHARVRLGPCERHQLLARSAQVSAEVHQHSRADALALADEAEQDVLTPDVVVPEL